MFYIGWRIWFRYDLHHREYYCYGFPCWWYEFWFFWLCWGTKSYSSKICFMICWLLMLVESNDIVVQGFYRNHMEEVIKFFETYHKVIVSVHVSFTMTNMGTSFCYHHFCFIQFMHYGSPRILVLCTLQSIGFTCLIIVYCNLAGQIQSVQPLLWKIVWCIFIWGKGLLSLGYVNLLFGQI